MRWPRGVRPTVGKSTDWVSPQRSQGGHKGHKGDFDGFDGLVAWWCGAAAPRPAWGAAPWTPAGGGSPCTGGTSATCLTGDAGGSRRARRTHGGHRGDGNHNGHREPKANLPRLRAQRGNGEREIGKDAGRAWGAAPWTPAGGSSPYTGGTSATCLFGDARLCCGRLSFQSLQTSKLPFAPAPAARLRRACLATQGFAVGG